MNTTTIVIRNDRGTILDDGNSIEFYPEIESFAGTRERHWSLTTGQTRLALQLWGVIAQAVGDPLPAVRYRVTITPVDEDDAPW